MSKTAQDELPVTIIKGGDEKRAIDFQELKQYRDLFFFLVWRDIKVLYAQTILGFSWAILNPFAQIVIFSIIFGKVANLDTGGVPYVLFSTVAIIPWTYMSTAMLASSQSLVGGQNMLGKIYFPRLIFPLTAILAKLVDFFIAMLLMVAVLLFYNVTPTWNLLLFPFLIVMMMCVPAGLGMWLSSLAIRFRDVKFAMAYVMSLLIYTAPILYSASSIPTEYRLLYSLNPIVGVVEGFRACFLGGAIPWEYILPGAITGILLVITGARYFTKTEKLFVDVI